MAIVRPGLLRSALRALRSGSSQSPVNPDATAERAPVSRSTTPRVAMIETLEERQLMSVVYVSSSSGKDSNSGLSQSAPVATIAKAVKVVKSGDTLLFKSGDVWKESLGFWAKNKITISNYGTGNRPQIQSPAWGIDLGTQSYMTLRNISLVGTTSSSGRGVSMAGKNVNVLIENCEIKGFKINVNAEGSFGPVSNLVIRNSQIHSSRGGTYSHGLFLDKVNGIRLENNLIDKNGGQGSMFNHGAYITAQTSGLVATGNTFSNSSNYGMQARSGGTITGNTFKNNSIGLSVGYVNGAGTHTSGGVVINVSNNTFTGVGGGLRTGYGIHVGNIKSGSIIGNKFLNGTGSKYAYPMSLERGNGGGTQVGINNLRIADNFGEKWGGTKINVASNAGLRNVTMTNNRFLS